MARHWRWHVLRGGGVFKGDLWLVVALVVLHELAAAWLEAGLVHEQVDVGDRGVLILVSLLVVDLGDHRLVPHSLLGRLTVRLMMMHRSFTLMVRCLSSRREPLKFFKENYKALIESRKSLAFT